MIKKTLKTQLIALILIVLIPLIVLVLTGIHQQLFRKIKNQEIVNINYTKHISLAFMNYLEESWAQQYAIGKAIILNPHWEAKDIEKYIYEVFLDNRSIKGFSWVNPEGRILASSNDVTTGVNVRDFEFFIRIINGEQKVVSNLRESIVDDELIIHIARGIYNGDKLEGIMLSIIDTNSLSYIFNIETKETSRFGLIDSAGMLVYMNKELGSSLTERKERLDSTYLRTYEERITTFSKTISAFHNDWCVIGATFLLEEIGWIAFYSICSDEVLGQMRRSARIEVLGLILATLASLILAFYLGDKYTKAIYKLKSAADDISRGNFNTKLALDGSDEIAAISNAFNCMAVEINNQISQRDEIAMMKTRFFSTVSHELKTPINIILGAVQLMNNMEDLSKECQDKYLKMQKQNSYRLLRLINNLIDINKIEGNQFEMKAINYDIVRLVEDITTSVVEYTKLKNLQIIFDTDVEEMIIAVDPDKIERIILNLISNAIKFTEPGGRIEVNIIDNRETIQISVKDTGIGIPEHMQKAIFEYFTQADSGLHRKSEGSGIGLFLVKSLVEMHGGTIGVNSKLDEGSEFIIKLPKVLNDSDTKEEEMGDRSFTNVERISIEFSDIYL